MDTAQKQTSLYRYMLCRGAISATYTAKFCMCPAMCPLQYTVETADCHTLATIQPQQTVLLRFGFKTDFLSAPVLASCPP